MPYTYLLRCADGSYCAGSTFNLERRLWQHNSDTDGAAYTRSRRPVELIWAGWFDSIRDAFAFEKQIQGWGREKREALIANRFDLLPELAASPGRTEWFRQAQPASGRLPVDNYQVSTSSTTGGDVPTKVTTAG